MAGNTDTSSETVSDAIEDATEILTDDATEAVEDVEEAMESAPVAATAEALPPAPRPRFAPLLLGGVLAGAFGFAGGYYLDWVGNDNLDDVTGSLETQSTQIEGLTIHTQALEAEIANLAPPEVDLSGIEGQITDLGSRLDEANGTLSGLDDRLAAVEARPIFTGDASADEAALTAAIDQLRADLMSQQEENAVMAEDIAAMADAAEARITQAEARADAAASTASAQAALSQLRIAIAGGTPFTAPLAEVADAYGIDVPEAVQSASETGVPTLAEIEAAYPAAARAALPLALQAIAGETSGERLTAFFRSQVGGRSLEPREGDDPDAILSRAGAAVATGDLSTAIAELQGLPEPALAAMSDWTGLAESRMATLEALDGLSTALGN